MIWQKMGSVGFRIYRIQALKPPTPFSKEKTKAQGGTVTCPRSPVRQVPSRTTSLSPLRLGQMTPKMEVDGGATHPANHPPHSPLARS